MSIKKTSMDEDLAIAGSVDVRCISAITFKFRD